MPSPQPTPEPTPTWFDVSVLEEDSEDVESATLPPTPTEATLYSMVNLFYLLAFLSMCAVPAALSPSGRK